VTGNESEERQTCYWSLVTCDTTLSISSGQWCD
jgi:hypothetical protein